MFKYYVLMFCFFLNFLTNCQTDISQELALVNPKELATIRVIFENETGFLGNPGTASGYNDPLVIIFHYAPTEKFPHLTSLVEKACSELHVAVPPVLIAFDEKNLSISRLRPGDLFKLLNPKKVTIPAVKIITINPLVSKLSRIKVSVSGVISWWFNKSALLFSERFIKQVSEDQIYQEILRALSH